MRLAEQIGTWAGAILSVCTLFFIAMKTLHRVNQILDTREDATEALATARAVEAKVDDLHAEIVHLSTTTKDTFATRTEEFNALAGRAARQLQSIEGDVVVLRERVARIEGVQESLNTRLDGIESTLADIRSQLTHLTDVTAHANGPSATPPPV